MSFPRDPVTDHLACSQYDFSQSSSSSYQSNMKDFSSTASSRQSRSSQLYPKKRPSPHGITKSHKTPAVGVAKKSPRSARAQLIQQRQRDLAVAALRRQGVLLEEEYADEIRVYMHRMEVRCSPRLELGRRILILARFFSNTPCLPLSQWINNPRFGGTCARALSTSSSRSTSALD